ncbi:hypothetical protein SAMN04488498_104117 [Mesorhizobium albiziae]|uniref:Uncharacterized protein n=1 Tax=Neomesorhizobium albiziae TaxID=335020 RepID=A0A1I3Y2I2_9HYPH|nr:hypothetical protein SAMN04488498_104117 [Mesorhizobium albiziae]
MGSGAWDRAVSNLYEARSPSAPPVFLPYRRERGFSGPRTSLGQARTSGHPRPSSATVSAADRAPSPSLIPGAHQVPVRAMQPLCGSGKGVWIKGRQRLLTDADNAGKPAFSLVGEGACAQRRRMRSVSSLLRRASPSTPHPTSPSQSSGLGHLLPQGGRRGARSAPFPHAVMFATGVTDRNGDAEIAFSHKAPRKPGIPSGTPGPASPSQARDRPPKRKHSQLIAKL